MLTAECVILSVCPPYLEIDQLTSSILRRHISSVFRQFSFLFSYSISLRISWDGGIQAKLVRFAPHVRVLGLGGAFRLRWWRRSVLGHPLRCSFWLLLI